MENKKQISLLSALLIALATLGIGFWFGTEYKSSQNEEVLSKLSVIEEKTRDTKRLNDIKTTQIALELYYMDNGKYPIVTSPGVILGIDNYSCLDYTKGLFTDKCVNENSTQIYQDPGDHKYLYISENGSTYNIIFELENSVDNYSNKVLATPNGLENK